MTTLAGMAGIVMPATSNASTCASGSICGRRKSRGRSGYRRPLESAPGGPEAIPKEYRRGDRASCGRHHRRCRRCWDGAITPTDVARHLAKLESDQNWARGRRLHHRFSHCGRNSIPSDDAGACWQLIFAHGSGSGCARRAGPWSPAGCSSNCGCSRCTSKASLRRSSRSVDSKKPAPGLESSHESTRDEVRRLRDQIRSSDAARMTTS